jgi:hypothetical protein
MKHSPRVGKRWGGGTLGGAVQPPQHNPKLL